MTNVIERLRQGCFDTEAIPVGATANTIVRFFRGTKGSNYQLVASAKTELDTNITTVGQFPFKKFTAIGVRAYAFTKTSTPLPLGDLNQLMHGIRAVWKRDTSREILSLPLAYIPSGTGIGGLLSNGQDSVVACATIGTPVLSNMYKILPEDYVQNDTIDFQLEIASVTMSAQCYIMITLEGLTDKFVR